MNAGGVGMGAAMASMSLQGRLGGVGVLVVFAQAFHILAHA